jgi:hypothetical protein
MLTVVKASHLEHDHQRALRRNAQDIDISDSPDGVQTWSALEHRHALARDAGEHVSVAERRELAGNVRLVEIRNGRRSERNLVTEKSLKRRIDARPVTVMSSRWTGGG